MNTSMLVLIFWGQRGHRKFESHKRKDKRSPFVDYPDESDEEDRPAKRTRGTATRGGDAIAKGACRSAAAPDEAAWVNPSLADATGLEDVNTGSLVEFMLVDCNWFLTNGKQKVQLLRNDRGKNDQDAVWTWFGDGKYEYCYPSTTKIEDVPGFRVPAFSGELTGEGWQLMHEVKANPADPELAKKVKAGETWVNYGLFNLADLQALMQQSSNLGSLMSRNTGDKNIFCGEGMYKLYVGETNFLKTGARWTHDYANSKLLGTITMHTGKEKSDAIVCSDADGSFSTITVTASRAAYKGEPGGVVFDRKTSAVRALLYGSAVAMTFELGPLEKSRIVRAPDECIVCYIDPPFKIPNGLTPFASCGHQDVCQECLWGMYERRQANCPQCRVVPFGGDAFMTLMRIMTQKKKIRDEHDALLAQRDKIERQLQNVKTEKDAMDRLSEPHMLQITSLGVSHEVAKEALEANDQNLELAITSALDITAEQGRAAEEKARKAQEEALRVYNTQWHDLKTLGKFYRIQVVVKDGAKTIEVFKKTEDLREYYFPFSSRITVEIHNHSEHNLTFAGKYIDYEEDSEEVKGTLMVQGKKKEQPAHYVDLWHQTFYRDGEYQGDAFVLVDDVTGKDILRIKLTPVACNP